MNLRDKILSAKDLETQIVPVPQWGVTVEVRGMSGRQRSIFLKDIMDKKGNVDTLKLYPSLIIASTFDPETGERVFEDGDFDAIAEKSGGALEVVAQVAMKLSGLDAAVAEKNLDDTQSESSTSN